MYNFKNLAGGVTPSGVEVTPTISPMNIITESAYGAPNFDMLQQGRPSGNMPGMSERIVKATLFIFSPKQNFNHMVRPYVYDFNDNNALELMKNAFVNGNEMITRESTQAVPALLSAIKPATQGHTVNLNGLSDCYTFMLSVESMGASSMVAYMSTPIFKNISVGYFIDEPLGPNGSINPRCQMKFTHHQRFQARRSSNNMLSTIPKQSHDVIPAEFRQMNLNPQTGMAAFVKMTPHHMREVPAIAMSQIQILGSPLSALDNMIQPVLGAGENVQMSTDFKYSPVHLRKITDKMMEAGKTINGHGIFNGYSENQRMMGQDFSSTFYNMLQAGDLLVNNGIGTWDIKYLLDVAINLIPELEIRPLDIQTPRHWDVSSSIDNNSKNVFNAWIGDTISQICEAIGITEMAFDYHGEIGNLWEKEGKWILHEGLFHTIFGNNTALVKNAFFEFKGLMENDLFFLLKQTIGGFTLSVNYSVYTAVVINLYRNDFNDNTPGINYEHPIQFGGLINPNIGTSQQYVGNCLELQNLVNIMEI